MKLAVDLDGCVLDYVHQLREFGINEMGLTLSEDSPTTYSMTGEGWFADSSQWAEAHRGMFSNVKYSQYFPLLDKNVPELFHRILDEGHEIIVLTARGESSVDRDNKVFIEESTICNLDMLGVPYSEIVFAHDKHNYDYGLLIEDNPHVEVDDRLVFVDHPYNREVTVRREKTVTDICRKYVL